MPCGAPLAAPAHFPAEPDWRWGVYLTQSPDCCGSWSPVCSPLRSNAKGTGRPWRWAPSRPGQTGTFGELKIKRAGWGPGGVGRAPPPDPWGPGMSDALPIPTKKVRGWGGRQRCQSSQGQAPRLHGAMGHLSEPQDTTAPVSFLLHAGRVEGGCEL